MTTNEKIVNALQHGFVENTDNIDESIKAKFLTNDRRKNLTVIDSIKSELYNCETFTFSVAFITDSGLNQLKTLLLDLHEKGVKGRIITSNYLYFNKPQVYKSLLKLKNVEVRISNDEGFHSKGYLFQHKDYETLILGSSNLTSHALKINYEWNIKISSTFDGEIINKVKEIIDETWKKSTLLKEEWITQYESVYADNQINDLYIEDNNYANTVIKPNKMQEVALLGIEKVRADNENKALLVSATGTGKTYLAAFDVKKVNPERVLFVVHREQILKDAKRSFQRVLGNNDSDFGYLTGSNKDFKAKYLFSTIQSIKNDHNLERFNPKDFDYIILDEAHRTEAATYRKIIDYFDPKFMLGMTATPERPGGENIFELFDYNIAYEIRLQEAMEEDLICPFHYFGVTDYIQDGKLVDKELELKYLVTEERVTHLIEKLDYYGQERSEVKGLIFASGIKESIELSKSLNKRGYRTVDLDGDDPAPKRIEAIRKLESGELDYIITVDIFNEGIDIPSINQVVMMRNTKSSIVFIQQLGRGLRKYPNKDFVTIIDYIGNYKNNFFIPIALSGENSLDKERIRKNVMETDYIKGVSSVNFERIAKERIFRSITSAKLDGAKVLKEMYQSLKNRLGRIPNLIDFYDSNLVDPITISNYKHSFYEFMLLYEKELRNDPNKILNIQERNVLKFFSREYLDGKRSHELLLIDHLIINKSTDRTTFSRLLNDRSIYEDQLTIDSVINSLNLKFSGKVSKMKSPDFPLVEVINDKIHLGKSFNKKLENKYFNEMLLDIIKTGIKISDEYDKTKQFTPGQLYTRRDASFLLNWETNRSGVIYGHMYNGYTNTVAIFVTYHKVNVDESINYNDKFLSNKKFQWQSTNSLKLKSKPIIDILEAEKNNTKIHLFVQKDKVTNEQEFYYIGTVIPIPGSEKEGLMSNGKSVVTMNFDLETPVNSTLYDYIISEELTKKQ